MNFTIEDLEGEIARREHESAGRKLLEVLTAIDTLAQEEKLRLTAVAEVISQPLDHVRVDFYLEDGAIWFSELTVYSNSGLALLDEQENLRFGEYWSLPDLTAPDPREAEWRALLEGTPKGTLQR